MMAGDADGLQDLSIRMGTAGRMDNAIKSTLDRRAQAIEMTSLKIDDRSLADGTYRSGHYQSPPCQSPPYRPPPHHPPPRYPRQHPQYNKIFYEEELRNHIYQYNNFEDEYEDEGIVYER